MAYLAFDNMKLLRLVTKVKTDKWPEGEAWEVMQSVTTQRDILYLNYTIYIK